MYRTGVGVGSGVGVGFIVATAGGAGSMVGSGLAVGSASALPQPDKASPSSRRMARIRSRRQLFMSKYLTFCGIANYHTLHGV